MAFSVRASTQVTTGAVGDTPWATVLPVDMVAPIPQWAMASDMDMVLGKEKQYSDQLHN